MPLQEHMKLISVDDHAIEHGRVWTDRLPARYQEAAPHVEERVVDTTAQLHQAITGSQQVWVYEGVPYPELGLNAVAGKEHKDFGTEPMRFEDMIPGCYDPVARVADLDLDGIQAQVNFPSFPRFAGTRFLRGEDKDLALLCIQAWNDWMLDEWCAAAPDRYIPLGMVPMWDVDASVAEAQRLAAKGCKTISFPENPVPLGLPSFHTDHWDRFFAVVEESGMPLAMHFGTSGVVPQTAPEAPITVMISLMGTNSQAALTDLLFSPVFHKFPGLKVSLAEGGIGWMPYQLERIDYVWDRHRFYADVDADVRPSDLFHRNVWGCFIDDEAGLALRHTIGIDRLTWECDYPHSDSNWPHARKRAAEMFADLPDAEVQAIAELNARALYSWDADGGPALEPAR
jgi:predicted TIM-barrel fold metal-dependent hydrolase